MQRSAIVALCLSLMGCAKNMEIYVHTVPCLEPDKKFDFKLCRAFTVQVDAVIYDVPQGFTTDLASVPRFLWWKYSPNDTRTIPAAILHDYMYRFNVPVTRKQADDIFYHMLIKGGLPQYSALKYYAGVRCFGWRAFRNYQR